MVTIRAPDLFRPTFTMVVLKLGTIRLSLRENLSGLCLWEELNIALLLSPFAQRTEMALFGPVRATV